MANRRDFLKIGLAGAAAVPAAAFAARLGIGAAPPLYKVVFDERFPASVAFARDLNRQGVPAHGIAGDVTALWYRDLYFHWKGAPAPIAGMTTRESLFCLELLACDAGLRVTHRRVLDEGLVSWVIGKGPQHG